MSWGPLRSTFVTGHPTDQHRRLIELSTSTAAIAIAKHLETHALRASEERLRLAVTRGNIGVWEWTIDTNRLELSDELKAILGWVPDVPLTQAMFVDAIHADDRAEVVAALDRSLAERSRFNAEFRVPRAASPRWIAVTGRAEYDAAGRPIRMLGVGRDITNRKRAQEETSRREAQLAEAATGCARQLRMGRPDQHGRSLRGTVQDFRHRLRHIRAHVRGVSRARASGGSRHHQTHHRRILPRRYTIQIGARSSGPMASFDYCIVRATGHRQRPAAAEAGGHSARTRPNDVARRTNCDGASSVSRLSRARPTTLSGTGIRNQSPVVEPGHHDLVWVRRRRRRRRNRLEIVTSPSGRLT